MYTVMCMFRANYLGICAILGSQNACNLVGSGHAHLNLKGGVLVRARVRTYCIHICTGLSRNAFLVLRSIRSVSIALY